jgi:hypothetical protein
MEPRGRSPGKVGFFNGREKLVRALSFLLSDSFQAFGSLLGLRSILLPRISHQK